MTRCWLVAVVLVLSVPAAAQQAQSPLEVAMGERIMSEVSANLQCRAQAADLQRQLAAAQARIKELEPK